MEEAREDNRGSVSFSSPESAKFRYSLLRNKLEELEMLGYVDKLTFAVGGNGWCEITDFIEYRDWIEHELEEIEDRISDEENTEEAIEEELTDITSRLEDFCSFVAEDGFLAFWKKGSTSNELKSNPEDIGRSQLMAYLAGIGTGYQIREAPSGVGFQDIVFIENPMFPVIVETKFLKYNNDKRYQEGIEQLREYAEGQDVDTVYYVIFHKDTDFEDRRFVEEGLEIIQRCVNVRPSAPTG